ncbi:MAG TPA: VOC family protein [Methylomirabilota bacterium]|nr:VOC family protein [Methylomirabilota bacterium]
MTGIRLDHIAIAVRRIADAPDVLVGMLGGVPYSGGPSAAYTWTAWRYANGGCLEVLEPRGGDGFLHRHLAARGPGVHHVTFRVPSLEAVCARAVEQGYRIVGRDESDPSWAEAFLHPKEALGIVVQFAESRVPATPRPWSAPPGPPNPPPPVEIVGLRMRARSVERADTQWARIVEGERSEEPGVLIYRWPDSPMRLTVEIAAEAEEGPIAVEYASARLVGLSEAPVPALGTIFRRRRP